MSIAVEARSVLRRRACRRIIRRASSLLALLLTALHMMTLLVSSLALPLIMLCHFVQQGNNFYIYISIYVYIHTQSQSLNTLLITEELSKT